MPMGIRQSPKISIAMRIARSLVANLSSRNLANRNQPPVSRTMSSPTPSHTASICGATKSAGTFNNTQRIR